MGDLVTSTSENKVFALRPDIMEGKINEIKALDCVCPIPEIGIMRALGYSSSKIAALFLGKALVIGLIGAAVGFGIGTGLALSYGPDIFKVTAKMIKPVYGLLSWSIIVAPAFAALSSFIPAMVAVTQDPALTLREG